MVFFCSDFRTVLSLRIVLLRTWKFISHSFYGGGQIKRKAFFMTKMSKCSQGANHHFCDKISKYFQPKETHFCKRKVGMQTCLIQFFVRFYAGMLTFQKVQKMTTYVQEVLNFFTELNFKMFSVCASEPKRGQLVVQKLY